MLVTSESRECGVADASNIVFLLSSTDLTIGGHVGIEAGFRRHVVPHSAVQSRS